ncbi:MAG: tRNA (adenosine(37)-N6)-threonylcarbamoyltransferase complex ATPase subunit type 1 TsaE [Thermoanaerobaculia bacterium]
MSRWTTRGEEETRALGTMLGRRLAPDGLLLVSGTLGAGKTVLAKGVAAALEIDPAHVQSPTYTLMQRHHGPLGDFLHVDLYRLDPSQVEGIGLEEEISGPGIKLVEWPERLPSIPPEAVWIHIERGADDDERVLTQHEAPPAGAPGRSPEGETRG